MITNQFCDKILPGDTIAAELIPDLLTLWYRMRNSYRAFLGTPWIILFQWFMHITSSHYAFIGDEAIARAGSLPTGNTVVRIEQIPVSGRVHTVEFFTTGTDGNLDFWLLRHDPSDPDEKMLTPIQQLTFLPGEYNSGLNVIGVDWPCAAGDRIGLTVQTSSVIPTDTDTEQNYWLSQELLTLDTKKTFVPDGGLIFSSFLFLYHLVTSDGGVDYIGGALDPTYTGYSSDTGPWTFAPLETFPVDCVITNISFLAHHPAALTLHLLRPPAADVTNQAISLKQRYLAEQEVETGLNEVVVDWTAKKGDNVGFTYHTTSTILYQLPKPAYLHSHRPSVMSLDVEYPMAYTWGKKYYAFLAYYTAVQDKSSRPDVVEGSFGYHASGKDMRVVQEATLAMYPGTRNLQTCLHYCSSRTDCRALSWSPEGSTCSISNHPADVKVMTPQTGFTVYAKLD